MLIVWLAALAAMARRQYRATNDPDLATEPRRLPPGAAFYAVRLGDRLVGMASTTIDTVPNGARAVERFDVTLPAGGRVRWWTDLAVSRSFALDSFASEVITDHDRALTRGVRSHDTLTVSMTGPPPLGANVVRMHSRAQVLLPAAVPLQVMFGGPLEIGREVRATIFDPVPMTWRRGSVVVAAESVFTVVDSAAYDSSAGGWRPAHADTVRAWRLEQPGQPGHAWVDRDGYTVEAHTAAGYRLERTAFEIVDEGYRRVRGDSGRHAAGRIGEVLAAAPPSRSVLMVVVDTADAPDLSGLTGGRQSLRGDTLVVRQLPSRSGRVDAPDLDETAQDFAGEPAVPSTHPDIAALARRVLGPERDGDASARQLLEWTARHIALDSEPSAPRTIAALDARRGDAAAHALIFTALARSAGLAARPVSGVVAAGGRWHIHSWAEVRLEGAWVAVDPTWGAFPMSAAAVRLQTGGVGRADRLIPLALRLGAPLPSHADPK